MPGKKICTKKISGFSLIEVIVAIAIIAILAGAAVPVLFHQLDEKRVERVQGDLQAIYEASIGVATENYFGFVGDVGRLPDSVPQLIVGTGQGSLWGGPYLSLAGGVIAKDVYGQNYVIDSLPIRVRSFGPDRANNSGTGDDMYYPENALTSYKGQLEVQVYINGRLISDATSDQVSAALAYSNNGSPASVNLTFDSGNQKFVLPSAVHQGKHVLTVVSAKATLDPATTHKEVVTILPGATAQTQVAFEDADYMTRTDSDLNGNGIPDRLEDMDGDGVPNNMDPDIDGDGTPNAIDPDSLDPTISGGGGGAAPMVNNVTPSYGTQGDSGLLITIDGSYFQSGATVAFSGTGVTVLTVPATFVGATQLTVSINVGAAAATGFRNVTVTNPDMLAGTGNNKFEVLASGGSPSPSISSVVPAQGNQGATGLVITLQGQNFISGAVVTFSNANITVTNTQFVNSSQVDVTINIAAGASTGAGTVRLTNPDAKFAESTFTVSALKPNIAQINPTSGATGTNNLNITVTGSDFLSGVQASSSGSPLNVTLTTYNSSTQVTVRVNLAFTLTGQQRYLILTNPGGLADSASFTINGFF